MARDDDVLCLGFPKKARQVVFDLGKGHFLHLGLPNRTSHDSTSSLGTIATRLNGMCFAHWRCPKIHGPTTAITTPMRMIATKTAAWITPSRRKCRLILNFPSGSDMRSN